EVFLAHIMRQSPRLSEIMDGIPPELDDLVASLLAKRPHERPPSAAAAALALRSMLHTYRSLEQTPDPRAQGYDGALTPLVNGGAEGVASLGLATAPGHTRPLSANTLA